MKLELADVRRLKESVEGATINDVILAICGGGLRRYLEATDERPVQSLVAMAPVSIRKSETESEGGNRVSMMTAALGTEIADPVARLQHVCATVRSSKKQRSSMGATTLVDAVELVPSALGQLVAQAYRTLGLSSRHAPLFNCIVTNVPGPQIPLYFLGARMTEAYPMVPLFTNNALGVALFSYSGGLYWGFNADWDLFPDLHDFVVAIDTSFHELCAAADAAA